MTVSSETENPRPQRTRAKPPVREPIATSVTRPKRKKKSKGARSQAHVANVADEDEDEEDEEPVVPAKRKSLNPPANIHSKILKLKDQAAELFKDIPQEYLPQEMRAWIGLSEPNVGSSSTSSLAPQRKKRRQPSKVSPSIMLPFLPHFQVQRFKSNAYRFTGPWPRPGEPPLIQIESTVCVRLVLGSLRADRYLLIVRNGGQLL